jgi:hypothetical protein
MYTPQTTISLPKRRAPFQNDELPLEKEREREKKRKRYR